MTDFFNNLNQFLTKDFVSDFKKILENPNNLSENIISYLNKNKIDLNNIIDMKEDEKTIDCDPIKDKNIDIQNDSNDYQNLFLRLNDIENTMNEVKEYLQKHN